MQQQQQQQQQQVQAVAIVTKPAVAMHSQTQTGMGQGTPTIESSNAQQAGTPKDKDLSSSCSCDSTRAAAAEAAVDAAAGAAAEHGSTHGMQTAVGHRHKSLLRLSLLMGVTMVRGLRIYDQPAVPDVIMSLTSPTECLLCPAGTVSARLHPPLSLQTLIHLPMKPHYLLSLICPPDNLCAVPCRCCVCVLCFHPTFASQTLHNLPEGFAVAFSAFTDIAPIMVLAIGLHNIPEGLICAAPLYAATGNKWQVRERMVCAYPL
jgi:hypothetical protein